MSRSRKKTPEIGFAANASSEKKQAPLRSHAAFAVHACE